MRVATDRSVAARASLRNLGPVVVWLASYQDADRGRSISSGAGVLGGPLAGRRGIGGGLG
jgi:hypothetical protein